MLKRFSMLPEDVILTGDCRTVLPEFPPECIDLILSDIPYGIGIDDWDVLHANQNSAYGGKSPAQEKAGAVFAKRGKPINGWSEADRAIPREYQDWCATWSADWLRVLKPGASAFVFAGRRYAHRCTVALEDAGFSLKDVIGWVRPRATHRAQRVSIVFDRRGDQASAEAWSGWRVGNLRPVFEPILWFTKPYKIGTTIADNALRFGVGPYNEAAYEKYAPTADNFLSIGYAAGEGGLHPAQKPVKLMQALIELTSRPGQMVLDPFAGSGSTALAANHCGRRYIGIEINQKYASLATERLRPDLLGSTR